MVREFNLVNDKGQKYSLMNIKESCLLTEPTGLGYTYQTNYEQLGNTFVVSVKKMQQGQILGQLNFLSYDNYRNIINFIEASESLKFEYTIPYNDVGEKTYYKDVEINTIGKSEIQPNGVISENITIDCLSLWYSSNVARFDMVAGENEIRWDFRWDSRFSDYSHRSLTYVNEGHTEAPIEVTINGSLVNPKIQLYIDGELYQEVPFTITLTQYEKLLYSTKENDFYLLKQNANGTKTNIFTLSVVNFNNDNVIRLPKDKSCEIRLVADNDITAAEVIIYTYYKGV